jgi:hypothetical protein
MKRIKVSILIILGILLIGIVSAATTCCERTRQGAWCQNVDSATLCDRTSINPATQQTFRVVASFCEATSYCKPGTCINGQEGTCMPNTPQIVCEANGGVWSEQQKGEISQCQLGCCLVGEQAAFTTQITCSRMSALYGLSITYVPSINDELSCLASASPSTKGACTYTKDYLKTCVMETKKECQDRAKNSALSEVEFHNGLLCTAGTLGANCIKTKNTQCDDKDDVRFVDSCGNLANIYDSSRTDTDYWTYIEDTVKCGDGKGNKDSATCGDCDYLSGSMCKKKSVGQSVTAGDYVCKNLDCKGYSGQGFDGITNYPRHGETWCATDSKISDVNVPGATYFRLMCYNSEVTNYECEKTRQQVCAETVVDTGTNFRTANCKVNKWQDCTSQNNSKDCLDVNERDCSWTTMQGYYFYTEANVRSLRNEKDYWRGVIASSSEEAAGMCVPKYQPGFSRDGDIETTTTSCGMANSVCYVKMVKGLLTGGKWVCDDNCSCIEDKNDKKDNGVTWASGMNTICVKMGDCGVKTNYAGGNGKYTIKDLVTVSEIRHDK